MRVAFTNEELAWLQGRMQHLIGVSIKTHKPHLQKASAKLAYKFTPNALVSYLTGKERRFILAFLNEVFEYVKEHPEKEEFVKFDVLKSIARKVMSSDNADKTDTRQS